MAFRLHSSSESHANIGPTIVLMGLVEHHIFGKLFKEDDFVIHIVTNNECITLSSDRGGVWIDPGFF